MNRILCCDYYDAVEVVQPLHMISLIIQCWIEASRSTLPTTQPLQSTVNIAYCTFTSIVSWPWTWGQTLELMVCRKSFHRLVMNTQPYFDVRGKALLLRIEGAGGELESVCFAARITRYGNM